MRFPSFRIFVPALAALPIILLTGFISNLAAMAIESGQLPEPRTAQEESPGLFPDPAAAQKKSPGESGPLDFCEAYADTFETVEKLLKAGRWTDAEVMVHQIRSNEPDCPLTALYLGRIQYYRKNDRQALALLNDLAERHPYIHQTYHFRGLIYSEYGLHTVALEEFHKVMMVNPTIGSGYFFRYILPFLKKDGQLIPAHIDSMLQFVTIPAARSLSLGLLAYFQDDYATALTHLKEVTATAPDHAGAWLYAGQCHEHMKMALNALHCYNRAIAIDDTYARAYLLRGLTKINEGNWYRGCRDLRKASELEHPAAEMSIRNFCRRGHFQ